MALSYPLGFAQFLGALRVEEVTFRLSHPQEHTRLGDGTIISASLGASLWTGSIRLVQANHPRHAQMEALIALMDQPGATFLCHDPRKIGPAGVPTGASLSSHTVVIHSVAANLRELRITGLPTGYFAGSRRHALIPIWEQPNTLCPPPHHCGRRASSSGLTPLLEVVPTCARARW